MRVRVTLDTATDIAQFVLATSQVKEDIFLVNGTGTLRVDGKSFLGIAHAREFKELWCECEVDITTKILPWVV
jgi:hypothetical protein